MPTRILIADSDSGHAATVVSAISSGYGSDISSQIEILTSWAAAKSRALTDENIIMIVRSYTGVASLVTDAEELYPRVLTVCPLGSNDFEELSLFANNEPPVIVTTGAGDTENRNNTAFGKGLEFWGDDLTDAVPGDLSSFSNGHIAGQLLYIYDELETPDWWTVRFRARFTALREESNRTGFPWDLRNGYGKIDKEAAALYLGMEPTSDPYLAETPSISEAACISGVSIETLHGTATAVKVRNTYQDADGIKVNVGLYIDENSIDVEPLSTLTYLLQDNGEMTSIYTRLQATIGGTIEYVG